MNFLFFVTGLLAIRVEPFLVLRKTERPMPGSPARRPPAPQKNRLRRSAEKTREIRGRHVFERTGMAARVDHGRVAQVTYPI